MTSTISTHAGPAHVRRLFNEAPSAPRSPWAVAVSVFVHCGVVTLLGIFAYRGVMTPSERPPPRLRYMAVNAPPAIPLELLLPAPGPASPPRTEAKLELPRITPEPLVLEPLPAAPAAPKAAPKPLPAPPAAPPPPKPDVSVGLFARAATPVAATLPPRHVQAAGFDAGPAVAPDLKLKTAVTGAFDARLDVTARPGTDAPRGTVSATGFDRKATTTTASAAGHAVSTTGFEPSSPGARTPPPARQQAVVKPSGFSDVTAVATTPRAARSAGASLPVEVLFKPTPAYTDDARTKKVEGEVVLEVEFAASGSVRVLRVVSGLGHGLDERAAQAATQIRFKPALEEGQPVAVRANVRIAFRLT